MHDLNVDKCKTVAADLSKLNNVVDSDIIQNIAHDKLVIKVNAIDTKTPSTSGLVTKTLYNSDKQGFEQKIEYIDKNVYNTGQKD